VLKRTALPALAAGTPADVGGLCDGAAPGIYFLRLAGDGGTKGIERLVIAE
jgi:hypothetical protein